MNFQRIAPLFLAAAILLTVACKKSIPEGTAAMINDKPITLSELDKQFNMQFQQPPTGNDDQLLINKLEVLRTMIDQEIMMQRAEKQGMLAPQSDIDAEFNKLKSPYTQEEFNKRLGERKMTPDDLKADIRRKLSIEKLINKEITAKINITDKDVAEFFNQNKAGFNLTEPTLHLAQILVTPQPDQNVRNLKNDKAQNDEQARQKIQQLEVQLKGGGDFASLAQNYSEDPGSAPNGGDLGFVGESSLEKANPELRRLVLQMQPGQISPIIKTAEGYRILKVLSKEPAGQRDLSDPRVQATIRETLMSRKDQLLRNAYLEVVRNEAKVENVLARTVAQIDEKK